MQKINKKTYSPKPSERGLYHIQATMRIHQPEEKDYVDHYHLLIIDPKLYPKWNENKGILGFDDFEILHKPMEEVKEEKFMVKFDGKEHEMSVADMKAVLNDNKESYHPSTGGKKLKELVEKLNARLEAEKKKPAAKDEDDLS